ncbi:MAG TPA: hypothetical protein VFB34_08580, partial [Chloroflexota bacterium]|nr:hypothetical protein [Chloroflexota bacterium]
LIQPIDKAQTQTGDYVVGDAYPNCPSAATTGGGTVVGGGQSAAPSQGSSNNLSYFGGPIVHKIHNYVIFWLPQAGTTTGPDGNSCPLPATASYNYEPSTPTNTYGSGSDWNYEQILEQYFRDLQGSSFYNLLGQYADRSTGAINNVESLGGVWSDPCGYTSTPTPAATALPGGTAANPVYDYDIQQEVLRAIKINHWPEGLGNQYYVYLGFSAATCFNPSTSNPSGAACDISGVPPAFCAYHGDFTDPNNGNTVLYANMTDGGLETAYACYSAPIGSGTSPAHTVPVQGGKPGQTTQVHDFVADAEVSITSHEQFETDTDSMVGTAAAYAPPLGWYDEANGEIGDKCAYTYGNVAPDGSNISLQNGDHYIVQQEYSNWANGCSLGDSHVAAQPFGGASTSIPVYSGWNLLGLPTSGLGSADALANDMQRKGQLPSGSVQALVTFRNGIWNATVPGYTADQPLTRTEGIYLLSGSSGSYAPTGQPYTSPASLTFQSGWNLVAPTWPNPGLTTDAMFNQIEAENRACQADAFTNGACNPTVSAIDTYGPSYDSKGNVDGAQFINWSPAAPDQAGNATWPEHQGNQVPFTAGMWVNTDHSLSWTPQGTECQQIASGMCR